MLQSHLVGANNLVAAHLLLGLWLPGWLAVGAGGCQWLDVGESVEDITEIVADITWD